MMLVARVSPVTADRSCCWLPAGNDGARPDHPPAWQGLATPCTSADLMPVGLETGVSAHLRQRCRLHKADAAPTAPAKSP